MKPRLDNVTLVCVDDWKPHLAFRAIQECLSKCDFAVVKFFTTADFPYAVRCRPIRSLSDYNCFMVKELLPHIQTSHFLVVHWDGYIVNPKAWEPDFMRFDYIGPPHFTRDRSRYVVGNGGFSLRSRKLLQCLAHHEFPLPTEPEDNYICIRHKWKLHRMGVEFARSKPAERFAIEGGTMTKEFGFHGFITKLPAGVNRPRIFHHSGSLDEIQAALPTIQALGGGVLFITGKRGLTPGKAKAFIPELNRLDGIWKASFQSQVPVSIDYDLDTYAAPAS